MKQVKRNFNSSDSYMLETSSALQILLTENLADFTPFDATLDAVFATDWLAKIEAGFLVMQHSQIKDIAAQNTDDVLAIMEQCRLKYNEVKFFAQKAFKNNENRQAEFGLETYNKVRAKNANMISFMEEMNLACAKYETQLLAAGMSQASIDEIVTLRDALLNTNAHQESYMKSTRVMTQERVELLNLCYESTRLVIDAAMVIYYNDYARRNMYVFMPTTGDKKDIEFINQAVLDESPIKIYTVVYEENRAFTLTNDGPGEVTFFLSESSTLITKKVLVAAGERIAVKAKDLGTDGQHLFVHLTNSVEGPADVEVQISLE